MPVMIVGHKSNGKGHTWLIDGIVKKYFYYDMVIHFEYDENWMYADEYYDTFDQLRQVYHINDGFEIITIPDYSFTSSDFWLMNWGYDGDHDTGEYTLLPSDNWLGYSNPYAIYHGFE